MQVNGELHHIGGTNQVTDNFSKREFILITEQNTNRPQYIKMEFNQAKCNLLDNVPALGACGGLSAPKLI